MRCRMSKDNYTESIWEAAQEHVAEWLSECSYCDRPSDSAIQRMIEGTYKELLEEFLEGTP